MEWKTIASYTINAILLYIIYLVYKEKSEMNKRVDVLERQKKLLITEYLTSKSSPSSSSSSGPQMLFPVPQGMAPPPRGSLTSSPPPPEASNVDEEQKEAKEAPTEPQIIIKPRLDDPNQHKINVSKLFGGSDS
eukprot:TRINITY_DN2369_c0_g1_i11.p2 TRINITY_DN2369_c0_g1~~TRINITY_DN2369_c0_g1_i11.p2  ORF type:complete len:134 (+),score=36.03 TRINITY_DN2369_c0_g1_i11:57-458(+)